MASENIAMFLKVLGLNVNKLPTLSEYEAAYRSKLKLHPDRGGDNKVFQEITEAARIVFEYLAENQTAQQRKEKEVDEELLKWLKDSTKVRYSPGNVVFDIDEKSGEH